MKFIEFDNGIVNTKYIGKIVPIKGINSYHGKYGITLILDGFDNMTEWFDGEAGRNLRFTEIKNTILW